MFEVSSRARRNPKVAIPVLIFVFLFCLVVDNGFKFITKAIGDDLALSPAQVSLQATIAGIIIGIGAVVYAALADTIPIRKLLTAGIGFIVLGSLIGFFGQSVWSLVLIGPLIQTVGLSAAETLYVIYVTKHIPKDEQKTYLGFSTACFQGSMLIGVLTGGYISANIHWTVMFLLPLVLILAAPFVLMQVPEEENVSVSHLDVPGLAIVSFMALAITLTFTPVFVPGWAWFLLAVAAAGGFWWHINRDPRALVRPEFFRNGRYVWALVTVLLVYSTQLGWIIMFPYMAADLHGIDIDTASLLIAPGYACAVLVGIFSGWIGKFLPNRSAIILALCMIAFALALPAVLSTVGVWVLVLSIVLFASGFALMYAPLVASAVFSIPPEKSGIALGFYNLTINIAIPAGIAYASGLMDSGRSYPAILWILFAVAVCGLVVYVVSDMFLRKKERV
ncbi:MFS transporter [Corynebacterium glucuronolyticum]|uniref:MFS transporter n=1 Tax=Corynebacterium glucuronolyticum TaxID=39791 RepID=A0A7T4EG43_9CORY|nr:MFS transporter [Corynebacterium glucuronolyticum]QQB46745.1 MFS transporter [Corynebacterium glucuronolyticum]WKD62432.1 Quinolone resistance protein NorB [Corynebacterium glucuronolyticum DSM 44120]SMB77639.1 MFS transporter, DHA2 family, metal-tetracycline-proton antiporter [Corynebacterium glucuronolyticum]